MVVAIQRIVKVVAFGENQRSTLGHSIIESLKSYYLMIISIEKLHPVRMDFGAKTALQAVFIRTGRNNTDEKTCQKDAMQRGQLTDTTTATAAGEAASATAP